MGNSTVNEVGPTSMNNSQTSPVRAKPKGSKKEAPLPRAGAAVASATAAVAPAATKAAPTQQLLLLAASSQPRRGSLPISRSQLRLNIEEAKLRRPPSTEIYIPSPTTRFEDTPLTLRKFLNTIRPEDSSEDDFSNYSTPRAGRSRRASSLKLPDKFKKKADLSPCSTPRSPRVQVVAC